jgi:hypothetical protein
LGAGRSEQPSGLVGYGEHPRVLEELLGNACTI